MTSGNSGESAMTSGNSGESVMTLGNSGESVMTSGNSGESIMTSHSDVRICFSPSGNDSYGHCAKHDQGASTMY